MPFAMDMLATRMEHTSEAKYVSAESPSTCTANLCVTLRPLREIKISVDSVHSVCDLTMQSADARTVRPYRNPDTLCGL